MRQLTYILTFIVSTTITACGQIKNKSNFEKVKLDIEKVDFIEIRNRAVPSDTILNPTKRLSSEQIHLFVEQFNRSKSHGIRKAITLFFIDVHLKDGTERKFEISGQYLKENNDYYFDLGDNMLVPSIWTALTEDHIQSIRSVFNNYIDYDESTDSQENKDLMQNSLQSLTIVTNPEDLDLLLNVWMYYDPTDFPTRTFVYEVLKANKAVSIEALKRRIAHPNHMETKDKAPFSELTDLLRQLEQE